MCKKIKIKIKLCKQDRAQLFNKFIYFREFEVTIITKAQEGKRERKKEEMQRPKHN